MWQHKGQQRPDFADEPGPGQESVWDYPRPPALVPFEGEVRVEMDYLPIVHSLACLRMLETASPPTFYLPWVDVAKAALTEIEGSSFCEWKGSARYWALANRPDLGAVAWDYPQPSAAYPQLVDYLSFYPGRLECYVNGERVRPQPGEFYGGWVTDNICGPVKGGPGTSHW